jgi:hypothetical protein
MQEACLQQLDEVAVEQHAAQALHVLGAALAQLLPLHPGHDQHLAAGEVRVDIWHQDACRYRGGAAQQHQQQQKWSSHFATYSKTGGLLQA